MTESSNSSKPVRAGRTLGDRYTLITRIAKGGMGEVWKARDKRSGLLVAAKVLRPELAGEEISLSRLRLEAKNTMRARHPNIAMVLDSGEENGQGWIVMELVTGHPLTDYVGDGKCLTAEQLLPILVQSAYALEGSAQAGIVHRDIKPANILVRPDGMVKLTDFGISYSQGQATLTAAGMVMGTAQYLAPEQAMGSPATTSGDLYSLGVIAYEALVGHRPFTGETAIDIAMAHVKEDPPDLPDDVAEPLANIVFGLLAKDPKDRPPSGGALVRALNEAAQQVGLSTAPKPLPEPDGVMSGTPPNTPTHIRSEKVRTFPTRREVHTGVKPPVSVVPSPVQHEVPVEPPTDFKWKSLNTGFVPEPKSVLPKEFCVSLQSARDCAAFNVSPAPIDSPNRNVSSNTNKTDSVATTAPQSKTGMWIIVALIVLTVLLIVIAMIRGSGSAAPPSNTMLPTTGGTQSSLEVDLWLSPVLDF